MIPTGCARGSVYFQAIGAIGQAGIVVRSCSSSALVICREVAETMLGIGQPACDCALVVGRMAGAYCSRQPLTEVQFEAESYVTEVKVRAVTGQG